MTLNEVVEAIDRIIDDSLGKIPENKQEYALPAKNVGPGKEEE